MSSTITIDRATLEQALEALRGNTTNPVVDPEQAASEDQAIAVIEQALAAPAQQEPVAWEDGPHLVVRADMRERLAYKGPWVDVGRAIPDKWGPFLYIIPPAAQPAQPAQPAQQEPVALTDDVVQKKWQSKWLGNALFECIKASGIVREDIGSLSVGELLFFAKDLKGMLETQAATPPAALVPLTDEQIDALRNQHPPSAGIDFDVRCRDFARSIEAAHGIAKGQP
jgi:hypothetical protein